MKLWTEFFNRIGVPYEAFQPNHDERECNAAEAAGVAPLPGTDGDSGKLDSASAEEGEARATARVFLIQSAPVDRMQIAVIGLALHGYTMKHHGWVVEMIRSYE